MGKTHCTDCKETLTLKQIQKAYRTKHNITDTADICEIAHKLTVRDIGKQLKEKYIKNHPNIRYTLTPVWGYFRDKAESIINCKGCEDCENVGDYYTHYTDKAQDIFNNHYDLICEQAGM